MTGAPKSYVAIFEGQFQETRGDLDGARASYRRAVEDLARAGQYGAAGEALRSMVTISVVTGEGAASDLAFARRQKLGGLENGAIAFLQAWQGDVAASQRSFQLYAAARPELGPQGVEQARNYQDLYVALARKNAQAVLTAAGRLPEFLGSILQFPRGWAYAETKDYQRAEHDLRVAILDDRNLSAFGLMRTHSPLVSALAHFYLGQVCEATGRRDQAVNEYQEFLSHFENSRANLPQIAVARAALRSSLP